MCATGKKGYPNGATAMREARKLKHWNRGGHALRPYHCPECGQFHLANNINRRAGNAHVRRWRDKRTALRLTDALNAQS